jgi:hypothetical protein
MAKMPITMTSAALGFAPGRQINSAVNTVLAQILQCIPIAALLAAGFSLGHFVIGLQGPTERPERSCAFPTSDHRMDERVFLSYLQACRS